VFALKNSSAKIPVLNEKQQLEKILNTVWEFKFSKQKNTLHKDLIKSLCLEILIDSRYSNLSEYENVKKDQFYNASTNSAYSRIFRGKPQYTFNIFLNVSSLIIKYYMNTVKNQVVIKKL
jgi:hypothetical protein